jgi:transposase
MTKKPKTSKDAADKVVKNIRRKTRQTYSSEEKIRIVLAGLRGEESISVLCRREGIAESLYYSWSKEFLEAGKRRLSGRVWLRPGCRAPQTASAQRQRLLLHLR